MGVEIEPLYSEFIKGVLIVKVQPNSPADVAGLREGDVIKSINRKVVSTVIDFQQQLTASYDEGRHRALVSIERDGLNRFVAIKLC